MRKNIEIIYVYTLIKLNNSLNIDATIKMLKPKKFYHVAENLGFYGGPDNVPIPFLNGRNA